MTTTTTTQTKGISVQEFVNMMARDGYQNIDNTLFAKKGSRQKDVMLTFVHTVKKAVLVLRDGKTGEYSLWRFTGIVSDKLDYAGIPVE